MADYTRAVLKVLAKHNCSFYKLAEGSHVKWINNQTGKKFILMNKIEKRHTANKIMKDAGIKHKF